MSILHFNESLAECRQILLESKSAMECISKDYNENKEFLLSLNRTLAEERKFQTQVNRSLTQLVTRSEERMNTINQMIAGLIKVQESNTRVLEKIIDEYSQHLDRLAVNRNKVVDENLSIVAALKEQEKILALLATTMQSGVTNNIQAPK